MKSKIVITKSISITFTESEANWLMGVMQNPLGCVHPDDEDKSEQEIRYKLFEALKNE